GSWGQGAGLGSLYGALENASVRVNSAQEGKGVEYQRDRDFRVHCLMGQIGRTADSPIGEKPVYVSYRHAPQRLDSVILDKSGQLALRLGEPVAYMPVPPALADGEVRLGNIYQARTQGPLTEGNLFPIFETSWRPAACSKGEQLLPKTMKKLREGGKVRILAWGDSITAGTYIPDWQNNRWQVQFARQLRQRFPKAQIELETVAWGGHNTNDFLAAKSGSPYNYEEKVLGAMPDLVVSEFHNDRSMDDAQLTENYARFLKDFREIGAEWLIMVPPYTAENAFVMLPPAKQRELQSDDRGITAFLRKFAAENQVALADGGAPFIALPRQGIPHLTVMTNHYNHPDAFGFSLMAAAVLEVF
ncbi:MAG: SGNH/GDSL hydrolase family protein, partial [Victivallales bacterium]|nr:SGNH/GDSL hydrolase family protein [Victivallales bacterium]